MLQRTEIIVFKSGRLHYNSQFSICQVCSSAERTSLDLKVENDRLMWMKRLTWNRRWSDNEDFLCEREEWIWWESLLSSSRPFHWSMKRDERSATKIENLFLVCPWWLTSIRSWPSFILTILPISSRSVVSRWSEEDPSSKRPFLLPTICWRLHKDDITDDCERGKKSDKVRPSSGKHDQWLEEICSRMGRY